MEETRRERKKRQTRELLVTTAFRLFDEQGYEQTTLAQITSAADVATKTFFNYFRSKDDVLFADVEQYYQATVEVISERTLDEGVSDVLLKTYDRVIARFAEGPISGDPELMEIYGRLVLTVPALQAKALLVLFDLQRRIAEALLTAFPDKLDPITAAAAVGSLFGAVQAAELTSREMFGDSEEEYLKSARRAIDVAMRGLRSL
ncbi:TetR/AcrR family transcriptional regulator [Streptosporangium sp. NBC_01639]|uniref:TetR/AcrR family transcriptional regulator n=1 Tax=Streptosporangium sp. NBC_01639 TaxID=2975948 RepID=UPI003863AA2D|nr:TetR/AcrR family transcriptional regulator [Streptosporangium sp. NBC_01639]